MKRLLIVLLILLISNISHSYSNDLWHELSSNFKLKDQSSQADVKKQIQWLLAHPTYLDDFAKNSAPYIFYILEEIKKQGLPGELALLPMIESNYNPFAYSHAGAAGLWQLMPGTSSGLGIKQNWWYDGRRGIISSTYAALSYMRYLNRFFKGNWMLSIAAYDAGEGTVQRAVRKNYSSGHSTNFWFLPLPRETKAYLPRLLAMASIIKYPNYFGIKLPSQDYKAYFSKIKIEKQLNLHKAAKFAAINYDELLKLNPGYNRWTTLPKQVNNMTDYLLLPKSKIETFKDNLLSTDQKNMTDWSRYEVKNGDNLSTIAFKNNSHINLIKKVNHLEKDILKIGEKLIIPHTSNKSINSLSETKRELAINHSRNVGPKLITHIVQPGETFSFLCKKYKVRPAEIIYWNRLKSQKLKPEQKIVIWKKNIRINKLHSYKVKIGDSLSKIAQKYHLSIKKIKQLNPNVTNEIIKIDQNLKIKKT